MDGKFIAKIVGDELDKRNIGVEDFCNAIGVSQSAFSQWKSGRTPRPERIAAIEKFLGIDFAAIEKSMSMDAETAELLEMLKDRQDLRILLRSGRDVPPSSVYELVSRLEKMKEDAR